MQITDWTRHDIHRPDEDLEKDKLRGSAVAELRGAPLAVPKLSLKGSSLFWSGGLLILYKIDHINEYVIYCTIVCKPIRSASDAIGELKNWK